MQNAGSKQMIECLIENWANVTLADKEGNSALILASRKVRLISNGIVFKSCSNSAYFILGNDDITLFLIEKKAHSEFVNKSWGSVLFTCITANPLNNGKQNWNENQRIITITNGNENNYDDAKSIMFGQESLIAIMRFNCTFCDRSTSQLKYNADISEYIDGTSHCISSYSLVSTAWKSTIKCIICANHN